MATATMNAGDAITGSLGNCYVTIEGRRFLFLQLISIEAKAEKNKTEVPIMGKTGKGNKATGWKGTGTAKYHYGINKFRELMSRYAKTGEDVYFDMQVMNDDPTTKVGRQIVVLKGCNFNGMTIAKLDADAEYLEDELEFTFEDFEYAETFRNLVGME